MGYYEFVTVQLVGTARMRKLLSEPQSDRRSLVRSHPCSARSGQITDSGRFVLMLESSEFWQDEDEPEEQVPDKALGF